MPNCEWPLRASSNSHAQDRRDVLIPSAALFFCRLIPVAKAERRLFALAWLACESVSCAGPATCPRTEGLPGPSAGTDRCVTVSIGACERQSGESLDALLKRADEALYAAKATGRNRVELAAA